MIVTAGDGCELFVADRDGDATPVVLCHSLASSSADLENLSDELAAHGHRVVSFDQRGHRRSASGQVSIDRLAQDVCDVVAATGVEGAVAVGHSSGGYALLALGENAANYLSAIVVVGTTARLVSPREQLTMRYARAAPVAWMQARPSIGKRIVRVGAFGRHARTMDVQRIWESTVACRAETRRAFVNAMLARSDLSDVVPRLGVSVASVRGSRDRVVTEARAREVAELAIHGTYLEVSGAGHMVPVEDPTALVDVVAAALR